ncbi:MULTISPECIES: hypothetical protein [Sediminibacillus]|uniref:hypothetical protein n=1 Tax=Sediminibacillus TaxID=482460 RepID=UPI0004299818|nr:hypothetical protein [Sediminibacillus terrae]
MKRYSLYIGILSGFTIAFLIGAIWRKEFDWGWWISMMIGGTIGCLVIDLLTNNRGKNR